MSVRVGLNLGAVHVSKRVGRKKSGVLATILVWSIVWPFKLLAMAFSAATKSRPKPVVEFGPPRIELPEFRAHQNYPFQPGWYNVGGQAWYWDGRGWLR